MERAKALIDKLREQKTLLHNEYIELIKCYKEKDVAEYLFSQAREVREQVYGKDVYIRGLIEFSNICKNDCYYCGIRRSNSSACRYRLTKEQILSCCEEGYELGFRTFVLQGGEDGYFTDDVLCEIVSEIKAKYPECAVTLSVGERSRRSYERLKNAGADRYLLRHETATDEHYEKLHPQKLTLENRKRCLKDLKELGFQVGCGFMVGSPYQTISNIAADIEFIKEFKPEMVGIGPFIPQKDTPFADREAGSCELTIFLLAIIRLVLPDVLLPATTALGTIDSFGREKGILAGANVVMPNLSPIDVREKYALYDNKISTGAESAECVKDLQERMEKIGYKVRKARGDHKNFSKKEK